jgi:hypothetical protein
LPIAGSVYLSITGVSHEFYCYILAVNRSFPLMPNIPHPDRQFISIDCAIITISDTRTPETDTGGQLVHQLLSSAGHEVKFYQIVPDEPEQIMALLEQLSRP